MSTAPRNAPVGRSIADILSGRRYALTPHEAALIYRALLAYGVPDEEAAALLRRLPREDEPHPPLFPLGTGNGRRGNGRGGDE
jgi:hypothetical protein